MCCAPGNCDGCGLALTEKLSRWCPPCWEAQQAKQIAADMARVQRIPEAEYTGPVWWDDRTWPTVAALRAEYTAAGKVLPAEVFAARETPVSTAICNAAEEEVEDYFGDGCVGPVATAEMLAFAKGWAERHFGLRWHRDESRVVVLENVVAP